MCFALAMLMIMLCGAVAAEPPVPLAPPDLPAGMVLVPAGEFTMGGDDGAFDEAPAHRVYISAFYIDRCEVTNAQFAHYVRETQSYDRIEGSWFRYDAKGCLDLLAHFEKHYAPTLDSYLALKSEGEDQAKTQRTVSARWRAAIMAIGAMLADDLDLPNERSAAHIAQQPAIANLIKAQASLPIRGVTWRDAAAYATWAGKRLPTEAQWEKAARGPDGRKYPWGSSWLNGRCRTGLMPQKAAVFAPLSDRDKPGDTGPAPVGSHVQGASPYGCMDMGGNVWEWTADWYGENYYAQSKNTRDPAGPKGLADGRLPSAYSSSALLRTKEQGRSTNTRKVIRGGGWSGPPHLSPFNMRTYRRLFSNPNYWHPDVGFRCIKEIQP